MIICASCAHPNPIGAIHCEACFTPMAEPCESQCPNCGAPVRSTAVFCGNCGFNLKANPAMMPLALGVSMSNHPEVTPDQQYGVIASSAEQLEAGQVNLSELESETPDLSEEPAYQPSSVTPMVALPTPPINKTQIQVLKTALLHVQTNTLLELPAQLSVLHIGKPNNIVPPDVDVSGFPDSDIVSRVHADIRIEGDAFYLEDMGSSNGTYVNNLPLAVGNRHKLRAGDRIALGKGDKVSFIFQLL